MNVEISCQLKQEFTAELRNTFLIDEFIFLKVFEVNGLGSTFIYDQKVASEYLMSSAFFKTVGHKVLKNGYSLTA